MSARVTRGTAARQAAIPNAPEKESLLQPLSNPPETQTVNETSASMKKAASGKKAPAVKKASPIKRRSPSKKAATEVNAEPNVVVTSANTGKKRKRAAAAPKIEEDPNELPHNLGKVLVSEEPATSESQVLEVDAPKFEKPSAIKITSKDIEDSNELSHILRKASVATNTPVSEGQDFEIGESQPKKRNTRKTASKLKEDLNELPHNLGTAPVVTATTAGQDPEVDKPPSKKRKTRKATSEGIMKEIEETVEKATKIETSKDAPAKKGKRKANPYGLTPGISPFPNWPHPTIEECHEVNNLLSKVHGVQAAPANIPKPSLTVSGCGEVPSILDAMIRTRLSAATTGTNSSRAFQGLVDRFGILKEGIGKGSVDWDAVRCADVRDVFEAIKSGGLADNKSKDIKAILEMVHSENQARRDALVKANEFSGATAPNGADNETPEEKNAEIARADQNVLSLDHIHALDTNEAMVALVQYPGIGVKTASCVMLFCMRRPSFAVDTHVFRLLKWLKWVPPEVKGEIAAFSHVEVRVPDELKYSLHQLFIKHGKSCGRCRAATGETSEVWDKGCIIDHLVTRTGKRKGGLGTESAKKPNGKKSLDKKINGGMDVGKKATVKKATQKKSAVRDAVKKKPDIKKTRKKVLRENAGNQPDNVDAIMEDDDSSELSDLPDDHEQDDVQEDHKEAKDKFGIKTTRERVPLKKAGGRKAAGNRAVAKTSGRKTAVGKKTVEKPKASKKTTASGTDMETDEISELPDLSDEHELGGPEEKEAVNQKPAAVSDVDMDTNDQSELSDLPDEEDDGQDNFDIGEINSNDD